MIGWIERGDIRRYTASKLETLRCSGFGGTTEGVKGSIVTFSVKNATYATMARYSGSRPLLLQRDTTTSPYQELIHASASINNAEEVLQI